MTATATVKGGLFESLGLSSLASISGKGFFKQQVAFLMGRKQALALREKATTLNGATTGSTAAKTYGRVAASTELGGVRAIESQELVNAATTSTDQSEIGNDLLTFSTNTTFGASPPANLDGSPLGEQR